ncbi:MAG: 30S ribosomal protein S17 [Anaerolineae bacterium]|nr:30S ribosomal protein S17 [Anaerolineae bacterium]
MANNRRRLTGQVVSNKMQKTVIVRIDRTYRHPLYGKVVRDSKRYMAHDENGICQMGDTVVIVESRPLSRHKRWAVQSIVGESASARTTELADVAAMADEGSSEVSANVVEPPAEN